MLAMISQRSRRVAVASALDAYATLVKTFSPLAYWRLGEAVGTSGSGSVADASGNGRNGTPTGITFGGAGAITAPDTSVDFDASSSEIGFGTADWLDGLTAFTIQFWCRPDSISAGNVLSDWSGSGNGHFLMRFNGGSFQLFVNTPNQAGGTVTTSVGTGAWQHVAVVYNGSQLQAYRNGSTSGTPASVSGTLTSTNSNPLMLGNSPHSTGRYDGKLDEFAIHATALSAANILAIYNAGIT